MAHDHGYRLVILKTPFGYLTSTGVTEDINSKDIIAVPISSVGGKWSSMDGRVKGLRKHSTAPDECFADLSKCETYTYKSDRCRCNERCCSENTICKFWNKRFEVELFRLYSI